jgi:hypothetical protein
MPDTKFAPYAPLMTVLGTIRHYRRFDPPERLSTANLRVVGVSESLLPRTVAALKFLNLVRDDMTTTEQFRALRFADDEAYQTLLQGILNESYKDVLANLDLATATDTQISNAFIPFSPGGQRERMITLFLALAREAGWEIAATGKAGTVRSKADASRPRAAKARPSSQGRDTPKGRSEPEPRRENVARSDFLFGVTDADIAALPDDEFDDVWAALGKIAKARARARAEATAEARPEGGTAPEGQ